MTAMARATAPNGESQSPVSPGLLADAIIAKADTAPVDAAHLPRAPRQRTLIRATMTMAGLPQQSVVIRNLSQRGMGVCSRTIVPEIGETIVLALPCGVEREAEVRWADGQCFGVELAEDIDLRVLGLSTQRRHAALSHAIDWRLETHYRADEAVAPTVLRRCC